MSMKNKIHIHQKFKLKKMKAFNTFTGRILLATFVLILHNEYIVYYLNHFNWNKLNCETENCTKIMLIADPQLLGTETEKSFHKTFAIHDADRFLESTFQVAYDFSKPDIIIFLGDILDEGSIANTYQFRSYVNRYEKIFHTDLNVKRVHIPGDNDIGGENGEYISNSNIRRFEIEFMKNDIFDYYNRLRFFKINRMKMDYSNPDVKNNKLRLRVALTHMPLLLSGGLLMRNVMKDLDPHLIFSAHWHESRIFIYPSTLSKILNNYDIITYNLKEIKIKHQNLEIMVPTSSYRMGKYPVGYGFAVIDNDVIQYTVLWSINRFKLLIIYSIWGLVVFILSGMKLCKKLPIRFRRR